jgi:hypothetical protein
MIRNACAFALAMFLCAHAVGAPPSPPAPTGKPADEKAEVLAALDRYLTALSEHDLRGVASMQTPDGMTYRARATDGGAMDVVSHPNSYWVDPARNDGHTHRERYWSPTVMIRGGIAAVWAPYEFQIDGKTSHCGVDVFDFVKVGGAWRVANAMWTVEPDGCAELRRADASSIRPAP